MKGARPAADFYAGYTNEILGYLPTAHEYQFGGYEAGYGYKSVGLQIALRPSIERSSSAPASGWPSACSPRRSRGTSRGLDGPRRRAGGRGFRPPSQSRTEVRA